MLGEMWTWNELNVAELFALFGEYENKKKKNEIEYR